MDNVKLPTKFLIKNGTIIKPTVYTRRYYDHNFLLIKVKQVWELSYTTFELHYN